MTTSEAEDFKRVGDACDKLGEHFDSVQIFCTRHESDGTINVNWGAGNWFARYGQVQSWLIKKNEEHCIDTRRDNGRE